MKAMLDTDICIYIIKRGAMDMLIAAHALSLSASLVTK
jgi:predicted nucleic acid-binding protein